MEPAAAHDGRFAPHFGVNYCRFHNAQREKPMNARRGATLLAKPDDIVSLTTPHYPQDWANVDSVAVDTVRVLAADAVQKVGNGHPGTAMSLAPLAYTLFQRQMTHD
jgi:hypothetical protein